jgi:hypothetical protein
MIRDRGLDRQMYTVVVVEGTVVIPPEPMLAALNLAYRRMARARVRRLTALIAERKTDAAHSL